MYPAFVNCTTIDWFSEWPNDALLEVAEKYLEPMDLGDDEVFVACIIYTLNTIFEVGEFYRTLLCSIMQMPNGSVFGWLNLNMRGIRP